MPTNNIILMITPSWGRSVVLTGWHFKEYIKVLKGKKLEKTCRKMSSKWSRDVNICKKEFVLHVKF